MRSLPLLLTLLCSCTRIAPWPELVERTIVFDEDVPEAYRAAVMSAADQWNDAAGSDLLVADDGKHRCRVLVLMDATLAAKNKLGNTRQDSATSCSFTVRLRPDMIDAKIAMTAAHECGHVLVGREHSEDASSVMFRRFVPGDTRQHITDDDVVRLDGRMSGHVAGVSSASLESRSVPADDMTDPLGCYEQ